MKKFTALLLALLLTLTFASCSTQEAPAEETTEPATSEAQEVVESDSNYPEKPIQLLLPTNPGGDIDQNGRLMAKNIEQYLGQPMVPVNVSGGGGAIASQQMLEAEADGYTFMLTNLALFTSYAAGTNPYSYADFKPVATTSMTDSLIFVVSKDSPVQTVDELKEALVNDPGSITFSATFGAPSQFHGVAVEQATGGQFKKIDIGSGSDKTISMLSGQVNVLSSTYSLMKDYLTTGEAIALGSICAERSEFAPDIATFTEQGIDLGPGFAATYILLAKPGTPDDVIEKVVTAIEEMMADEAVLEEYQNSYFASAVRSGDELTAFLDETAEYFDGMSELVQNDTF